MIGTDALSAQLVPFKEKLGVFQPHSKEEDFAARSQRQSFTPSIFPTSYVVDVDEIIAEPTEEVDYSAIYLSITFLSKLKHILYNNIIYNFGDAECLQFLVIRSLVRAHVTGILFMFS